jgi:predicted metal-dependent phosphoesterase TrpH
VTLTPAQPRKEGQFPTLLKLTREPVSISSAKTWFKGELHCHTLHSDGDSAPLEIVQRAESLGLDFLAITDHNNQTHLADLAQIDTPLILIPGYEVTTYYGHWNIWGDQGWIDFRIQTDDDLRRAITEAKQRSYLVSCNHPKPYGPDWAFGDVEGYDCVEIWNGPWEVFNSHALNFWQTRLAQGQKLSAVGGSDTHFLKRDHIANLACPTTYIYCDEPVSAAALLRSVQAGHVFVTESPDGPQLYVQAGDAMMGDTVTCSHDQPLALEVTVIDGAGARLEIWGQQGMLLHADIDQLNQQVQWSVDASQIRFVRAQLVADDKQTVRAVSNPIYLI